MSNIDDGKNIQKLLQIRLLYILFAVPYKVVFKDFAYFLRAAYLRNNSLLVRAISITCAVPYQRLFVPNEIFIGVVLGRSLKENDCCEFFYKSGEVINEGFTS